MSNHRHPPTKLKPGAYATVTTGASKGTVVRLIRTAYAPPGCDGCAVHTLQPPGPVWVVDQWLDWVVLESRGARRYRLKIAPWTALEPVMIH